MQYQEVRRLVLAVCVARQQTPTSININNVLYYINTVILHIETVTSHQQLIAHFIYIN